MIGFVNKYVFGVGVPVLLIISGLFFCFRLRFFHFLHPIKMLRSLRRGEERSGVSSAKALALALAGTLGVGNMVGVASAIALGGYGAVFWMWVSALLAMVLKYAEIVLAMRHRRFDGSGKPYGAAMYYIRDLFKGSRLGSFIALLFALLCVINALSMGGMIQVGAAARAMEGAFGAFPIAVGAIFSFVAFLAMKKGSMRILSITEKLVPLMTLGFGVLSVAVICLKPSESADAISLIFNDAFSPMSALGGIMGVLTSNALRYGTMRGILSNEAGCGTAPAAHAVSHCEEPARQGVWGIFEVFVDTILLCTLTAVVIIVGGGRAESGDYMMMTIDSYTAVLGDWAGGFIAFSVLLFALATVLCWGHYGLESMRYISKSKFGKGLFITLYCTCVICGSVFTGEIVWECADLALGGMTLINLTVILAMNGEVKEETERYFWRG